MKNSRKRIFVGLFAIALMFSMSFSPIATKASSAKFYIEQISGGGIGSDHGVSYFTIDDAGVGGGEKTTTFPLMPYGSESALHAVVKDSVVAWATNHGYTGVTTSDVYDYTPNISTAGISGAYSDLTGAPSLAAVATSGSYADLTDTPPALSFNNAASHSIVTTAAAANGWQISSTRNSSVFYSVNVNTTATIGGGSDGYVVLEIAATNSTTASDWKEVSRTRNGQSITLAIALQSVQNIGGELMNIVPAGYYARLRSVTVSGTPTYTYVSGQEVQL